MLAISTAAVLLGVEGSPVTVEVHATTGLPAFAIVGQPDGVCREARDRVRSAIQSSDCNFPLQRITVNLAPSSERKSGAGLDLAIAVALLAATEQIPIESIEGTSFLGELGLDGTLRPIQGMVPLTDACIGRRLVVPLAQVAEASLVGSHDVRGASELRQVVEALRAEAPWPTPHEVVRPPYRLPVLDLADVRGQPTARMAIEVAAAGGHHLLLTGPPGAGKTMLAERLTPLLPDLGEAEALEATRIHSAAGSLDADAGLITRPPYVAPHHTTSSVALIGGGTAALRPGAVSTSHRGVLFLDELAEFPPVVLDTLRQPMEEGVVRVHRAVGAATFPARFLLVAAMNPCPCGDGLTPGRCRCTPTQRLRGMRRVSVPLLDRFDLRILVPRPDPCDILGGPPGEATVVVAARVAVARERAVERGVSGNALLRGAALERRAPLTPGASALLDRRLRTGTLSARGLDRIRRVSLTIADLDGHDGPLTDDHVHAALGLRHEVVPPEAMAG